MRLTELDKFLEEQEKLEGFCNQEELNVHFVGNAYPMTMYITPVGGVQNQMSMLEEEHRYTSPDAVLTLRMRDAEIEHEIRGRFAIGDATLSKLKNAFKRLCTLWALHTHRETIALDREPAPIMPDAEDE